MTNGKFETAKKLKGKGTATALIGTTASGKSTFVEALATSEDVEQLLEIREAHGKGSTKETEIIVTDCKSIPEDELLLMGTIHRLSRGECNDDNMLLGDLLLDGVKEYAHSSTIDALNNRIAASLDNKLAHSSNDELAYKLRNITEDNKNSLLEILRFDDKNNLANELMIVYNGVQARAPRTPQTAKTLFIDAISARPAFNAMFKDFWDKVLEIINKKADSLEVMIENAHDDNTDGLIIHENADSDRSKSFFLTFRKGAKDTELFNLLLKSEDYSQEYLLSDLTLIYRGKPELFADDTAETLVVSEQDGEKIRCIRLIDTKGLFHSTDAKVFSEADRIIDILSIYHTPILLLAINSMVTDTVKKGYEAITKMIQDANREIKIILLFTHWDQYLTDMSQSSALITGSKFVRQPSKDWDTVFSLAKQEQKKWESQLTNAIAANTQKKQPSIIGTHYSSFPTEGWEVLEKNHYTYPDALAGIMKDITSELHKNGRKIRVSGDISTTASFTYNPADRKDIAALYNNLVVDCMGDGCLPKPLYAATVRACVRKWTEAGDYHKSDIDPSSYKFENIETKFVQYIRNLVMLYKNSITVDTDQFVSPEDKERFMQGLLTYLSFNQCWGRQAAMMIGEEAYHEGFENKFFSYQYARFADMLEYTRSSYFSAPTVAITGNNDKLFIIMEKALKKCVEDYVNAFCIQIY